MEQMTVEDWDTGNSISLPLDPGYAHTLLLMHLQLHHTCTVRASVEHLHGDCSTDRIMDFVDV